MIILIVWWQYYWPLIRLMCRSYCLGEHTSSPSATDLPRSSCLSSRERFQGDLGLSLMVVTRSSWSGVRSPPRSARTPWPGTASGALSPQHTRSIPPRRTAAALRRLPPPWLRMIKPLYTPGCDATHLRRPSTIEGGGDRGQGVVGPSFSVGVEWWGWWWGMDGGWRSVLRMSEWRSMNGRPEMTWGACVDGAPLLLSSACSNFSPRREEGMGKRLNLSAAFLRNFPKKMLEVFVYFALSTL